MGDKTIVTHGKSSSSNEKTNQEGDSFNQIRDKLLSAVDILEMDHKKMLCFIRGQKPLVLDRIISHEHPLYKKKLSRNPTLQSV
jgi:type IV secretion system protein VirD4